MPNSATLTEETDPHCRTDAELVTCLSGSPWRRLVVLGDSVAEGLGDPVDGYPATPWADRLAGLLRAHRPDLEYLNLGRRDLLAEQVRAEQLGPALAFAPDLAVVACGGNDMLRRAYVPDAVDATLTAIVSALRAAGSDVITMGLFDIASAPIVPESRRPGLQSRLRTLCRRTKDIARLHGAWHVDLTSHVASPDPSLYSADGLHVNGRGHAIVVTETVRSLAAELATASEHAGVAE